MDHSHPFPAFSTGKLISIPFIIPLLPQYYPSIIPSLSQYHPIIIPLLSQYHPIIIPLLSQYHPIIIPSLSQYYPIIIPLLSQYYPIITPLLSQYYPIIIPVLSHHYPIIIPIKPGKKTPTSNTRSQRAPPQPRCDHGDRAVAWSDAGPIAWDPNGGSASPGDMYVCI